MSARVTLEGDKEFERAIRDIEKSGKDGLNRMLSRMAIDTQREAILGMQQTPRSGRVYTKGKNRNIRHVASTGGKPPAIDTGNLVRNVTVESEGARGYNVGSRKGAFYGFFLEFGTRFIQKRPWLTPAYNKVVGDFRGYIKRYIK